MRDVIRQTFQISDHLADGESIIVNYDLEDTKDQSLNQHVSKEIIFERCFKDQYKQL